MSFDSQLKTIKQNWLLVLLIVVLIGGLNFFKVNDLSYSKIATDTMEESFAMGKGIVPSYDGSFAPEVQQREITKTSFLTTEISRGSFYEKDLEIKNLVEDRKGLITNENRNKIDNNKRSYLTSSYTIKIPVENYENLLVELKKLGDIESFTENKDDITEQKLDIQNQLAAERSRLANYQKILTEAKTAEEKLQVTDRIFYQERTIKYLEDALKSATEKVSYSTIYLTINEKKSNFTSTAFITLSSIIGSFISSINYLIKFLVIIVPWTVVIYIIYRIKKRN